MEPRNSTELIVIHCAATKTSMDVDAATIKDWHVNGNGWRDIGYHKVIKRSGEVEDGRDIRDSGAHAAGYNHKSIGICLFKIGFRDQFFAKIRIRGSVPRTKGYF